MGGTRDSSRTRVAPLFDELARRDPRGTTWLVQLLRAFARPTHSPTDLADPGEIVAVAWNSAATGRSERSYPAPTGLLELLIREPSRLTKRSELSQNPASADLRRRLIAGDVAVRDEALRLLHAAPPKRGDWWVFEGLTRPDVVIETRSIVLVIEGKRTEAAPTTYTTWMRDRDQLLRHIDAAAEAEQKLGTARTILGGYLVEGDQAGVAPPAWMTMTERTADPQIVETSLPHRTAAERKVIAGGYLGVASFQQVCDACGVSQQILPT